MDKAVVLARGLGTRMRKEDNEAALSTDQAKIAEAGVKALIPIDRPFLDYVLSSLADAGYRRICLVIGPEHGNVRDYYQQLKYQRLSVDFAIQPEPLGTADAVAAAEQFADHDDFLVINSDNYYPKEALAKLRQIDGSGLALFSRQAMVADSNIEPERIMKFAAVKTNANGCMQQILEKPTPEQIAELAGEVWLSMNCWRFGPSIFEACRNIKPSARSELEITDAVQYAIDNLGQHFQTVKVNQAVLDMSSRKDIEPVAKRLRGMEIRL